ncbi:MAG: VWA domain-containing protein [Gammaproteobacteria bacterium]
MNIEFAWPWLFAALPLPLLVSWLLPRAQANPPASLHFPWYTLLQSSMQKQSSKRSLLPLILAILAWLLLLVAAAKPQLIGETVHLPLEGRSMILAIDISGSMMAEDMQLEQQIVTRLEAVKQVAGSFVEKREGDRLGLILFADNAYLQTPLTFDRKTVHTLLMEAQVGLAGKSTAIGDAIGLAVKRLRDQPEDNRVLVLMTDGVSNAGHIEPLKAADLAAQEKIRIYTIGIGIDQAGRGSFFRRAMRTGSDLDETTLRAIAEKTGGSYFLASNTRKLQAIYAQLDKIEAISQDEESYRPVDELYMWPLAAALLLSIFIALLKPGVLHFNKSNSGEEHA